MEAQGLFDACLQVGEGLGGGVWDYGGQGDGGGESFGAETLIDGGVGEDGEEACSDCCGSCVGAGEAEWC